jgi:hypothetical protein
MTALDWEALELLANFSRRHRQTRCSRQNTQGCVFSIVPKRLTHYPANGVRAETPCPASRGRQEKNGDIAGFLTVQTYRPVYGCSNQMLGGFDIPVRDLKGG